jgi:outer membrane protein OmpA-like peptidoglycan-associated protein
MKTTWLLLACLFALNQAHGQASAGAADEGLAPEVQWANRILGVSSQYPGAGVVGQYSAEQALGKPNVLPSHGSSACAWAPLKEDNRYEEFITLGFARPMAIRQVAVAENCNPGAIARVYVYDEAGTEYLLYRNLFTKPVPEEGRMFCVITELTPYKVAAVKLILSTIDVPGRNQIDAVGITASTVQVEAAINLPSKDSEFGPMMAAKVANLGPGVNTTYDELLPVVSPDGRTLYFDRKNHPDNVQGSSPEPNDDIWVSQLSRDGTWGPAKHLGEPLNNQSHNYVCSVTPDGNTLLLANKYMREGVSVGGAAVSISHRLGPDEWSFPQEVQIKDYYSLSKHSEFSLASNQQALLAALERNDTYGDRDLYVCFRLNDTLWSEPKNLGPQLNSAAMEMAPFLAPDNQTLYFASNGRSGYGSMDIFVARRLDDSWTKWSEPVNLGPTVNSPNWDAFFTIDAKGENAYFVSYNNSLGPSADIFRASLPREARPAAVVLLTGKVANAKTGEPLSAQVFYETLPLGTAAGSADADPVTGEYKIVLPYNDTYGILAKAPGFLSISENIDLKQTGDYQEVKRDLLLVPIEVGQSIRLNNVFFEQGTANLLAGSFPELDRIAELMTDNPQMRIELEGHTDIDGPVALNLKLAEDRVRVIKKYLSGRSVPPGRIKTTAIGPKRPITRKRDEASKQLNRRVEFKVLKF